jgi:hypothetical protein
MLGEVTRPINIILSEVVRYTIVCITVLATSVVGANFDISIHPPGELELLYDVPTFLTIPTSLLPLLTFEKVADNVIW